MRRVFLALLLLLCFTACNRDPNVAKRKYVDSGNKYFEKGKYKEALIMYRNALKRDMKFGEAYYRSALAELKLQRWGEASRSLQRSIESQPENLDAHTKLANLYLNFYLADRRRPKQLLTELHSISDKISKRFPNSYDDARLKGYLALFEGNAKSALDQFGRANQVKPYQPDLVLVYMQTLGGTGQVQQAEALGLEMLKKDPAALSIYDALFFHYMRSQRQPDAFRMLQRKLENNPKVPDGYLQLAAHQFALKDRDGMMNTLGRLTANKKDFPKASMLVGDFFLRIREWDLAMERYSEGAKQAPNATEKHAYEKRMVEILVKQDKKDEAQKLIQRVLKEDPKDPDALAIRASLSLLTGTKEQLQSAINDLQTVITKMPDNPVLRYNLGRALYAKQDVQAARVQLEEAIKLRPDYLPPRFLLSEMMLRGREFGKVIQMAQDILRIDPGNAPARLLRSRALIGMNDYKAAREELQQTTAKFPELPEARLQMAALDFQDRNYKGAEEGFLKIYEKSQDPRALMGLIETYTAQKQPALALKLLREELAKKPDRMDLRVVMANVLASAQDYPGAIGEYKKVLERVPNSSNVWMRLGEAQYRSGDSSSAESSFKKAQELAPSTVDPVLRLAMLYESTGRVNQGKPVYEQILRLQPDNPIALNNLAFLMAESGTDLDQALTMAQKARQQRPTDNNVADTLGVIYIKKNLSDTAIGIFQELVQKEPERATFRLHLAMALYQKGDRLQAKKECEIALKSKPAKDEEAKIRDLLSKLS